MTTPVDRTGYTVVRQDPPVPGGVYSYTVLRDADGRSIGAYFDNGPGGDVEQAITADRALASGAASLPTAP